MVVKWGAVLTAALVMRTPMTAGFVEAPAQVSPVFHFTEQPGPHPVGLKVVEQYDESRIFRHLIDELGRQRRSYERKLETKAR